MEEKQEKKAAKGSLGEKKHKGAWPETFRAMDLGKGRAQCSPTECMFRASRLGIFHIRKKKKKNQTELKITKHQ